MAACGSGQDPTLPAAAPSSLVPSTSTTAAPTSTSAPTSTTPAPAAPVLPAPAPGTCPAPPPANALDPARPTYDVAATVDVAAGVVEGTETIAFTPDLPTGVLVLRLWANGPRPEAHLDVTSLVDAGGAPLASTQPEPTTLEVELGRTVRAGERVGLTVGFRLTVTGSVNDRISRSGESLRLGSAFPLLAWEPGVGWAREAPTAGFAEATTSPAADWTLRLDVTDGFDVLASGRQGPDGAWRAVGARDVGISIGRFPPDRRAAAVVEAPHPVDVVVAVDASLGEDPAAYLRRVTTALDAMADRYGPFPWDSFSLAITPGLEGGIEHPGHVMQGPGTIGRTTPHEVAHQWFYGLVGNDQGRDPWLDEGLASWAEFRHDGAVAEAVSRDIPADAEGRAGEPMSYWEGHQRSYYRGVYVQPAAALGRLGAPELVDCALRLYAAANAWRIATPTDALDALAVVFPDARAALGAVGIDG